MDVKNEIESNDNYKQKKDSFKLPGNKIVNWYKYYQSIPPDEWKNLTVQQRQKEKDYYSDMYHKDMWYVNSKGWLILKTPQNLNGGFNKISKKMNYQQKNSPSFSSSQPQKLKSPIPQPRKSKSPTPQPPKLKSTTPRPSKPPVKSQKKARGERDESDSEKEEEDKNLRKKLKLRNQPPKSPKIYKAIPVPVYTPMMQQPSNMGNPHNQYAYRPPPPQHYSQHNPPHPPHFHSNSLSNPLTSTNPFYFRSF